jgi:hypothetical protein
MGILVAEGNDDRDRVAYLRQLALDSLNGYAGGFTELERVNRDLKWIIRSLDGLADPSWTGSLLGTWGSLEATYASALAQKRSSLTKDEEVDVRETIAELLAEFRRHELPLNSGEMPRKFDAVRLLRPLPEHDLQAGARGTVVEDYTEYLDGSEPAEFLVEFAGPGGATQALVNVPKEDLEVAWRPGYSDLPRT